jgi:uncharacterized protein YyaL (SSP411 family)
VGYPDTLDTRATLAVLRDGYWLHQVVAVGYPDEDRTTVPILRHRAPVDGRATAYVCMRMVCQLPVIEAEELRAHLAQR